MQSDDFNPKRSKDLEELIKEITGVFDLKELRPRCLFCGRKHFPEDETFITIYGNITVGLFGGVIGNNFTEFGSLGRVSIICRSDDCIEELRARLLELKEK